LELHFCNRWFNHQFVISHVDTLVPTPISALVDISTGHWALAAAKAAKAGTDGQHTLTKASQLVTGRLLEHFTNPMLGWLPAWLNFKNHKTTSQFDSKSFGLLV